MQHRARARRELRKRRSTTSAVYDHLPYKLGLLYLKFRMNSSSISAPSTRLG